MGGFGQKAVSQGQPFTPQQLLILETASAICCVHPGLCGFRARFNSPLVCSTITLPEGSEGYGKPIEFPLHVPILELSLP